jgi:indolepyruvate ferredoxin oxidoreductase beta subunit
MKALRTDPLNIVMCGVGGQGNVLLARLIGRALLKKGYHVMVSDTFGASQRNGAVESQMRISTERMYGPVMLKGQAHVILGLEPMETLKALGEYGNPDVVSISNYYPINPAEVNLGARKYPARKEMMDAISSLSKKAWFVDATPIALKLGNPVYLNVIMSGVLVASGEMPLEPDDIRDAIKDTMPPVRVPMNLKAFDEGMQAFARVKSGVA